MLWYSPVSRAAADAFAAHAGHGARFVRHVDIHRVGVLARRVGGGHEFELEPRRAGDVERIADAGVVGGHAQQACHERLVGSVAAVGVGEAAVQGEGGLARLAREQAPAHERDAQRARGVAARGADHDGSYDVADAEDLHRASFLFRPGRVLRRGKFRFAENIPERMRPRA